MRASVAGGDDPGFQMEEAPVDLLKLPAHLRREAVDFLIDPDDAFADELDLAHEPLGHDVEVAVGLGRARGKLGPEVLTELLAEALTEFPEVLTELLAEAHTEFPEVLTEFLAEGLTEFRVHATTLSADVTAVKCIVRATPNRASI